MKERLDFLTRFKDISERWNLSEKKVFKILEKATFQLCDEICDETPFEIKEIIRRVVEYLNSKNSRFFI